MSIQKLVDQTHSYFVEAQGTDLSDLYKGDLNDFESVQWLLNADLTDDAIAKIDRMDTAPREQIVLAIASEYGNGHIETVLGYEVA